MNDENRERGNDDAATPVTPLMTCTPPSTYIIFRGTPCAAPVPAAPVAPLKGCRACGCCRAPLRAWSPQPLLSALNLAGGMRDADV